jgi:hypothetical protein
VGREHAFGTRKTLPGGREIEFSSTNLDFFSSVSIFGSTDLDLYPFKSIRSKKIGSRAMRIDSVRGKYYPEVETSSFPRPILIFSRPFRFLARLISIFTHLSRFGRRKSGHGRRGSACGSRASIRYEENTTRRSRNRVFLDQP